MLALYMDLFFNPNRYEKHPLFFSYGSQPPSAGNMVSLSICQVSIYQRTCTESFCNELILKLLLHSPITIIVIWRGRDTKHTMTKAVTTAKENERRHLLLRQAQIRKKNIQCRGYPTCWQEKVASCLQAFHIGDVLL